MGATTAIGLAQSIRSPQSMALLGDFFQSGSKTIKENNPFNKSASGTHSSSFSTSLAQSLDLTSTALVLDSASKFVNIRA